MRFLLQPTNDDDDSDARKQRVTNEPTYTLHTRDTRKEERKETSSPTHIRIITSSTTNWPKRYKIIAASVFVFLPCSFHIYFIIFEDQQQWKKEQREKTNKIKINVLKYLYLRGRCTWQWCLHSSHLLFSIKLFQMEMSHRTVRAHE